MTNKEGPPLVPLERVAMPTDESTDKATRRMITQIKTTLTPRFPVQTTDKGINLETRRYVTLANPEGQALFKAGLRVTNKDYAFQPGQPVRIVSGMCLFGASGLKGLTAEGQEVSLTDPGEIKKSLPGTVINIVEEPFIHISETQTILQVSQALRPLAGENVSCFFHLPKVEYKLYLLGPFQEGKLSAAQLEQLFAKIDRRAGDLTRLVTKRMPLTTTVTSPLEVLDELLMKRRGATSLADCLQAARDDWLMARLIQAAPPTGFVDLNNLSYVSGYMTQAQLAAAEGAGCLAVDMAEEAPIFDNAKILAQKTGLNLSMAVLLLPPSTVSLNGRYSKKELFMHQPDGLSPLAENKIVFQNIKGGRQ